MNKLIAGDEQDYDKENWSGEEEKDDMIRISRLD